MRVKKLSANRRHKPGDDDSAIGAGGDQEQRRWVSPTKPRDDVASSSSATDSNSTLGAESGASSPTDPYSVHPVELQDANLSTSASTSPLRFQLDQSSSATAPLMAKNMSPQLMVAQDAARSGSLDASKPRSWHDVADNALREAMHAKIVEILRALKPNAPEKVLERVPGLAYRMEESLFRMAPSEAEYRDFGTLPQRLAQIQEANAKRLLQQQSAPGSAHTAPSAASARNAVNASPRVVLTEDQARVVFQCLQTWRQKLVNMYGVAPWEILPNQALAQVALHLPSSEQELAACGVEDSQIARFGSSLLQELQQICNVWTNASNKYNASPAASRGAAKPTGRKAEGNKRPATDASGSNKRRKASSSSPGDASFASSSSRLAPAPALNSFATSAGSSGSAPLMSSSQLLFRPSGIDTLPTLLPSASVASAATSAAKRANAGRLSPPGQVIHPPLFSRIESGRQEHNHMHLLAQGAGQVSKQQLEHPTQQGEQPPSTEAYEKEIQTLRWMLHQSQHEKSQLEAEVQHLRQQLGGH